MVINTNIMALSTANLLGASSQRLSQSLARLSSGSKINSPADDAAGLAVSMNFNAQIGRTDAANNNVANALSFSQTQDGYLQQVSNALDRMSELAVQAQDVTKSNADRGLYNQEFQTLATYINNVATKDFNGVSLFSGTNMNVTSDSEGGTFAMKGISGDFGVSGTTNTTTTQTSTTTSTPTPRPASATLADLSSSFSSAYLSSDGPNAAISISQPTCRFNTINDVVGTLNELLSSSGTGSAAYDNTTGQLSVTLGAGEKLMETGSDLFGALGLSAADLDNSAGGTSKTVTSLFTTAQPTTTEVYAASTPLGQLSPDMGSGLVQVDVGGSPLYSRNFSTTDTLQDLVDFINSATSGQHASYDSSTGKLSLSSGGVNWGIESQTSNLLTDLGFSSDISIPTKTSPALTHSVATGSSSSSSTSSTTTSGAPDISTADDAKAALTTIKNAISTLASDRAKIGANMERLNSTSQELSTLANNLSAANSRITDVDVATESTNYARENILVQTGTAMLAQANALPQSVLKLLG